MTSDESVKLQELLLLLHTSLFEKNPLLSIESWSKSEEGNWKVVSKYCQNFQTERFQWNPHNTYMYMQGSPHIGREWSAPTTTQQFLPPLRFVLPPLTEGKKCWSAMLMQFYSTLAKV